MNKFELKDRDGDMLILEPSEMAGRQPGSVLVHALGHANDCASVEIAPESIEPVAEALFKVAGRDVLILDKPKFTVTPNGEHINVNGEVWGTSTAYWTATRDAALGRLGTALEQHCMAEAVLEYLDSGQNKRADRRIELLEKYGLNVEEVTEEADALIEEMIDTEEKLAAVLAGDGN